MCLQVTQLWTPISGACGLCFTLNKLPSPSRVCVHLGSPCVSGHLMLLKLQDEKRVKGGHFRVTYGPWQRSDCLPNWTQLSFSPSLSPQGTKPKELRSRKTGEPAVLNHLLFWVSLYLPLTWDQMPWKGTSNSKLSLLLFFSPGRPQEVIRVQEVALSSADSLHPSELLLLLHFSCSSPQGSTVPSAHLPGLPLALHPTSSPFYWIPSRNLGWYICHQDKS